MEEYYRNFISIFYSQRIGDSWKLLISIVFSITFAYILRALLNKISQFILKKNKDPVWIDAISDPFIILIFVVSSTTLIKSIGIYNNLFDHNILISIRSLITVICLGWFLIKYSNLLQHKYLKSKEAIKLDKGAVDALGKLSKLIIVVIVILLSMDILGFNIRGVLTFAGVGGIAVAFASKELLANFFGTIIIYFDKPFSIGDFIKISKGTSGYVEYVGWRMTKIRTIEKTPIYIPNSIFSSDIIENCTQRTHRMLKEVVGVRYNDMYVLKDIISDIKQFLDNHHKISSDQPIVVGFDEFADSSVNFLVRACVESSTIPEFYDIKTEIMLYVYEIIKKHKADMAFPTRTIIGEAKE